MVVIFIYAFENEDAEGDRILLHADTVVPGRIKVSRKTEKQTFKQEKKHFQKI